MRISLFLRAFDALHRRYTGPGSRADKRSKFFSVVRELGISGIGGM